MYLGAGMWVPGATGLVVGALLLLLVRDSPEAVGYPPVETVQAKPKEKDGSDAPKESLMSLLLNNVLRNPFIWGMAFTYFFVYVVRQGVTSWFVFYLIKVRNHLIPFGFLGPFTVQPPFCARSLAACIVLVLARWYNAPRLCRSLCPCMCRKAAYVQAFFAVLRFLPEQHLFTVTALFPAGQGRGGRGVGGLPRVGPGAGRPVRQPAGRAHQRQPHRQQAQGRQRGQARAGAPGFTCTGAAVHGCSSLIASKPKGGNVGKRVQVRRTSPALL